MQTAGRVRLIQTYHTQVCPRWAINQTRMAAVNIFFERLPAATCEIVLNERRQIRAPSADQAATVKFGQTRSLPIHRKQDTRQLPLHKLTISAAKARRMTIAVAERAPVRSTGS